MEDGWDREEDDEDDPEGEGRVISYSFMGVFCVSFAATNTRGFLQQNGVTPSP